MRPVLPIVFRPVSNVVPDVDDLDPDSTPPAGVPGESSTPAEPIGDADEAAGPEATTDRGPVSPSQRRENVRVAAQFPITLRLEGYPEMTGKTRDLSAEGCAFATRLPLDREDRAEMTIHFQDWSFTKGVVVKFVRPILAGRHIGVQFDGLTPDERETIVKEVFSAQRELLHNQRRIDVDDDADDDE